MTQVCFDSLNVIPCTFLNPLAITFWYFEGYSIAFKRVVIDSETINGFVDTSETAIAKILNKNQ